MQFLYLRNRVSLSPVAQIKYFLQLGSIFSSNTQQKREKANREKIKCRQTVLQRCTLCNLIAGGGRAVPILRKKCHSFPPTPLISNSSQMRIFIYSTYRFLLQPPSLLRTVLLTNNIYSQKSKLKHTSVDIKCFFVNKIFVNET